MKLRRLIFILLFSFAGLTTIAQYYEVPIAYSLKTKGDFEFYEPKVLETIDWLQKIPFYDQHQKRLAANRFLVIWATGSPSVSVDIGQPVLKFTEKNKEMLIIYTGGYIKYALLHKTSFDKTQATIEGLRAIANKYQVEPDRIKDTNIEMLVNLDKNGKLDDWVKTDFNKG